MRHIIKRIVTTITTTTWTITWLDDDGQAEQSTAGEQPKVPPANDEAQAPHGAQDAGFSS